MHSIGIFVLCAAWCLCVSNIFFVDCSTLAYGANAYRNRCTNCTDLVGQWPCSVYAEFSRFFKRARSVTLYRNLSTAFFTFCIYKQSYVCIFINIIFVFTSFFAYFRWRGRCRCRCRCRCHWHCRYCVYLLLLLLLLLFFCQIIVIECYSLNYSYKIQYRALLSHRDILENNILNAFSFQTKNKLNQNKERRTKAKQFLNAFVR